MVWSSSAQGIRPYEREVYPNHIGVSLYRLSPPPLFSSPHRSRVPSAVEGSLLLTPLEATLTGSSGSVHSKRLTETLSLLEATLTKKPGGGGSALSLRFRSLCRLPRVYSTRGHAFIPSFEGSAVEGPLSHGSVPQCLCGHPHAPLWSRWSPVGAPLFFDGKRPLSLFSSCRYRSFFFTTWGGTPPPPVIFALKPACPDPVGRFDPAKEVFFSLQVTSHQSPRLWLRVSVPLWLSRLAPARTQA